MHCSGCNLCACLLVGAQQRSMNNHPDRDETALRVPCITKWRGKELLKLLCCNLSCDVVGEARMSHLGPLSAYFPGKWHFLLLSYLPAKLQPVLLLTLILVLPKADLATKAHVPPPLLLHSGPWNGDCSCFGGRVPGIYWQF